ncbi:MOSC and FAD-binding oxidoreductase domain-containing protein [Mycolicibacterium holsaticum]|uniref:Sulfurase n=1 Tax=Mycolicibacterium holsaticum TaxID=152142 RepID=A0A1E3RVY0_9MYCO|nr:MOSC and FAD-binding oxidoreductase domain-containing protein [Mycolicibacterium holsaticum]ODQ93988.1 sulfurase [Mycolicibacterium holsaticum]
MAKLVSANVGLPRDVPWQGGLVRTAIFKTPVEGPVLVRRLNVDGDAQGDLNGHGGVNRAVMVYQTEAYDYWRAKLGRDDLRPGEFGENFTVTGLADDTVCIGDRYRIGAAEFEVTQPRVTCFRVGLRLGVPDMAQLLVAHRRPGFYFRVLTEGHVCAGDPIVQTRRGPHQLSVAEVDALLYLPNPDRRRLEQAVDNPALSPGWVESFRDLLASRPSANAVSWQGFRPLRIAATRREAAEVMSLELAADEPLAPALPGQYLTLRVSGAGDPAPLRSYSLSGAPTAGVYRISVKRDRFGQVSRWLHDNATVTLSVEAAAPRGDFYLTEDDNPVVLLSAGIGVTPLLAMLHHLAATGSTREVCWIHTTRGAATHAFADEVSTLIDALPAAEEHIFYTGGSGHRLDQATITGMGLPRDATVYLCGPTRFMEDMQHALTASGTSPRAVRTELFGARSPINPGAVTAGPQIHPHPPAGPAGIGPAVTFARSGLTVAWSPRFRTLLELSEACDIATRYSCRSGVCHTCATAVVAGGLDYVSTPLNLPADGEALICCAAPRGDLVLDL